ncbi:MAG: glycosyltransferase, partial [Anaerotruncus rubiinfantis]
MTFIKEVVDQLVKRGVTCSVIAPQSITKALKPRVPLRKAHWIDLVDGHPVDVYQPHYFSLSNFSKTLYEKQMTRAVGRAYRRIRDRVDVVYCHFWHMGIIASRLEQEKPLFLACGESHITVTDNYASQDIDRLLGLLRGVIYVGSKAYVEASTLGLQKGAYLIAPNGYNKFFFHPMDRRECRQRLGWDQEAFILSFVGIFTTRKGADRLNRALTIINRSDEKKVYAAFIGKGEHAPTCEGIVFQGQVSHDDLCRYLNATDIFVLPTNNEGCCNSI